MLNIGDRVIQLRKTKNWSQDELAKEVGSSRIMIGKYERNENAPSIEVLVKIARAFDVSVGFLVGEGKNASFDKELLQRLEEVEALPEGEKGKVYDYIDLVIRDFKAKQAYS